MTLSCWQQDPSRRPTAAGVVRNLREWSAASLPAEPASRRDSRSYTLRAANMPSPALVPLQRVRSVGDVTSHAPILLTPSDGTPAPTQPSGTTYHSDQSNPQTHEISTEPSSIGVSCDPHSLLHEQSPDESHAPSNSGNANSTYLFLPLMVRTQSTLIPEVRSQRWMPVQRYRSSGP